MKQIRVLALLLLLIQSVVAMAQTQDKEATQDDETKAAVNEFKIVEARLNAVFSKILTMYKSDTQFIKNIKASQDLWIKFRAAELKAKFPEGEEYGSVYTMCINDYLTELTNERISKLNNWITGTPEGDVCSGSVKINN